MSLSDEQIYGLFQLSSLNIVGNLIKPRHFDFAIKNKYWQLLSKLIEYNNSDKSLHLNSLLIDSKLTDEAIPYVIEGIINNGNYVCLYLGNNHITDEGFRQLFEAIINATATNTANTANTNLIKKIVQVSIIHNNTTQKIEDILVDFVIKQPQINDLIYNFKYINTDVQRSLVYINKLINDKFVRVDKEEYKILKEKADKYDNLIITEQ